VADDPKGFVSLKSLKQGEADPQAALDELRKIYFKTTKQTIENDLVHAIELFKRLPEDAQEKGVVYMEGIGQMRKEWEGKRKGGKPGGGSKAHKPAGKSKAGKPPKRRG
jgi:hypothetical protein